ncbi:DegT/DnrJ/EryC1/StrS family aminotransferase [bacterium]|nr:MAG: DegT/DnrJ/EryC1/StrS family aminotransferase [bacterium]
MKKLAINGGPKTIEQSFPHYNSIGENEILAVEKVMRSGQLSKFLGSWGDDFLGGPKVKEFEDAWAKHFGVRYAVSVNSLTSGLIAAVGAIGIEPFDEVITSPWTMCATATSILVWNGIPVFADIDEGTYNLDPKSVEKNVTERTRAIIVPDIFGQSANLKEIMKIAKQYNLKVIEDAAQAPHSLYREKFTGTTGHIGGFSLNYHKHIHTGEGGMMVTNDKNLAERMQLIRNHGEAAVGGSERNDINNIIGFNFRLGEIEAAIGLEQLKRLPTLSTAKTEAGSMLCKELSKLHGIYIPKQEKESTHVYYIFGFRIDESELGISRETIINALRAEGVPHIYPGYANLHLLPLYQKRIAYGSKGFPWISNGYTSSVRYEKGTYPIAERLHEKEFVSLQMCQHSYTEEETNLVVKAFKKVWENLNELRS